MNIMVFHNNDSDIHTDTDIYMDMYINIDLHVINHVDLALMLLFWNIVVILYLYNFGA